MSNETKTIAPKPIAPKTIAPKTNFALHTNDTSIPEIKNLIDTLIYLEEVTNDVGLLAVVSPILNEDQEQTDPASVRELYDMYEDCELLPKFELEENEKAYYSENFTSSIVHIIADQSLDTDGVIAKIKEINEVFSKASLNGYFGPETKNNLNIVLAYNPGISFDAKLRELNETLKYNYLNSMLPVEYSINVCYIPNLAQRITTYTIDNKEEFQAQAESDTNNCIGLISVNQDNVAKNTTYATEPFFKLLENICVTEVYSLKEAVFVVTAGALKDLYLGTFATELNVLAMVNELPGSSTRRILNQFNINDDLVGINPLSNRSIKDISKIKYVSLEGTRNAADLLFNHSMIKMAKSTEYLINKIIPGLISATKEGKVEGREHIESTDLNIGYFGIISEGARVFEEQLQEISKYLTKVNDETGSNHRILAIDVKNPIGTDVEFLTTPFNYDLIIIGNEGYVEIPSKTNEEVNQLETYTKLTKKLKDRYCSIFDVSSLTLYK